MSVRDLLSWHRRNNDNAPSTVVGSGRDPLQSIHDEVDRLFGEVFQMSIPGQRWPGGGQDIWPRLDISDDEKEIRIVADLPGMEQKDINVSLADGVLTLKGEKRSETEDKNNQFSERFYGRFERRIPIGYELDDDKIDARFENGVLKVTLPKTEAAASREKRIEIKS